MSSSNSNDNTLHEDSFWEFVACSACHLPFSIDGVAPPPVPFWLTECGHILCNSHLNADQSCQQCKAQKIELMPLSRDLPQPMADWFCSMPHKLDGMAQAAKFQQESLSTLVRYYKNKCTLQRNVIEAVRKELNSLKAMTRELEELRQENEQLRRGQGQQRTVYQQYSDPLNSNGKRPRGDPRTLTSSPRTIATPVGPQRLTLPPDHDPPPAPIMANVASSSHPPGTSAFSRQYAFNPSDPPRSASQQFTSNRQHQSAMRPANVSRTTTAANSNSLNGSVRTQYRQMPPPPTPQQSLAVHVAAQVPHQYGHSSHPQVQLPPEMTTHRQERRDGSSHASWQGGPTVRAQSNMPYAPNEATNVYPDTTIQSRIEPQTPRRFVPPMNFNGASGHRSISSSSSAQAPAMPPLGAKFGTSTNVNGQLSKPPTPIGQRQKRFMPAAPSGRTSAQSFAGGQRQAQRMAFTPLGQNR